MNNEQRITQFSQYYEKIYKAMGDKDIRDTLDILEVMKTLIDDMSPVHSRATGFFALTCYDALRATIDSGQADRVEKRLNNVFKWMFSYADKALGINPLEFRAQLTKTAWASDELATDNNSFGNILSDSLKQPGTYKKTYDITYKVTRATIVKKNYTKELERLIRIFRESISSELRQSDEFIFAANNLLLFADYSREQQVGPAQDALAAIIEVDLEKLTVPDGVTEEELPGLWDALQELQTKAKAKLATL